MWRRPKTFPTAVSADEWGEPPNASSREELQAFVKSFPYWYHRIYLGQGVYTLDYPVHHEGVWNLVKPCLPSDLFGVSILDVGCNAGFFSIQLKRRGAKRVLGIESVDDYYRQAELCRRIWGLDIEYRAEDAHSLSNLQEQFDIVIFTGILYHLKNPLQVAEELGRVCRDAIIVETEVIPENSRNSLTLHWGRPLKMTTLRKGFMKFVERDELNGDGSNWWVPDTECVQGMLRTAGFQHFSKPCYFSKGRLLLVASKQSNSRLNLKAIR